MRRLIPAPLVTSCETCNQGEWRVVTAAPSSLKLEPRAWYIWSSITGQYVLIGRVTKATGVNYLDKAHEEAHRRNAAANSDVAEDIS